MTENLAEPGLLLRFRDLVTEPGGNISEHRRIIDTLGFAWWGWWARSFESTPAGALGQLLEEGDFPIVLFDSGLMHFFLARCTKIVVSPTDVGISSPDFRATPHYYVRGSYPAWFKLHGSLKKIAGDTFRISGRPTLARAQSEEVTESMPSIDELRDERPTLWLIQHFASAERD